MRHAHRHLDRCLRLAVAAAVAIGLHRRDASVVANGVAALAIAHVPGGLEHRYALDLRPWQRLWISATTFTHAVGMLGTYDRVWWWDHVAHVLSASSVGGVAYVVARTNPECDRRFAPTGHVPGFVLGSTLGLGLLWELLEYVVHALGDRLGIAPLLISYGRLDTALDLVFDAIGGGLVVLLGPYALENVVRSVDAGRSGGASASDERGGSRPRS
ncbi:hypothetical protein [Halalkalicoccus sp. NIPERK01]|uniref:hypothetical protein n=1 Tax=Halalkalicoccus sp. NIPERK01 TaxID=3053469 RepID=UPI00256EC8C5|nr:hypothetical protein [Halalkalicoccus sp. NIPERK01]MDL5360645.1 hypothetical protein [Halalkalicoccus sp. NIPERK01]